MVFVDYSKGFGGKYGVQKDRQDKAAVGWEHHEQVEKHESQKGNKSKGDDSVYLRKVVKTREVTLCKPTIVVRTSL